VDSDTDDPWTGGAGGTPSMIRCTGRQVWDRQSTKGHDPAAAPVAQSVDD
jgi:predicted Rdx family selenoprotein